MMNLVKTTYLILFIAIFIYTFSAVVSLSKEFGADHALQPILILLSLLILSSVAQYYTVKKSTRTFGVSEPLTVVLALLWGYVLFRFIENGYEKVLPTFLPFLILNLLTLSFVFKTRVLEKK